ncbi:hypothetical protein GCM10009756_19050 [Pseudokineococcus marinus]
MPGDAGPAEHPGALARVGGGLLGLGLGEGDLLADERGHVARHGSEQFAERAVVLRIRRVPGIRGLAGRVGSLYAGAHSAVPRGAVRSSAEMAAVPVLSAGGRVSRGSTAAVP